MSVKSLLQLLSIGLLCLVFSGQGQKAVLFAKKSEFRTLRPEQALYRSVVTGNKEGVPKKTIQIMKDFGLMHLMTPSGLHLGSFLLALKVVPRIGGLRITRIILIIALLSLSPLTSGFYALKRMLVFYFINHWLGNTKLSFVLTLLVSLISGNFSDSPISFAFSAIFWGTIVFHSGSKYELAWRMFFMQALVALFLEQKINLLGLIINPLASALFAALFPLLLTLYPLELTRPIGESISLFLLKALGTLDAFSFLTLAPALALFIILIKETRFKKTLAAGVLFVSLSLQPKIELKRLRHSKHYPIPNSLELINQKGLRSDFIDRRCKWKLNGEVSCRFTLPKHSRPML